MFALASGSSFSVLYSTQTPPVLFLPDMNLAKNKFTANC